ncbi:hypothetical protein G195_011031 [Phytophthora kernoviae 00238/432]|uniref:Peptidase S1 domain-containing protein n=1 Tax=Phytophthora kernoviae 00238/432 TaxID=1284355 RepID=A0A8J4W6C9_9STRA|nr:hypothetical protein G195_011031 [Phytophthora kernoviae 00238/432]
MKTFFTLIIMLACATNTYGSNIERKLIVGGDVVPANAKTYTVDVDIRWASIGSHFRNGTQDGEQIRVISIMNHPNYQENMLNSDDFLVLELEKPSSFKPVKLAAADDSDFKAGKWATTMGWGIDADTNGTYSYELQRLDVQLASDEACANFTTVDSSMVCAGGVLNKDTCFGDSGGPLIVETSTEGNSTEDVLVGVVSWGKGYTCAREGYYGVYSRVSSVRAWIDSITGGNGTCLS